MAAVFPVLLLLLQMAPLDWFLAFCNPFYWLIMNQISSTAVGATSGTLVTRVILGNNPKTGDPRKLTDCRLYSVFAALAAACYVIIGLAVILLVLYVVIKVLKWRSGRKKPASSSATIRIVSR